MDGLLHKSVTLKTAHQELVLLHVAHLSRCHDVMRLTFKIANRAVQTFNKLKHGYLQESRQMDPCLGVVCTLCTKSYAIFTFLNASFRYTYLISGCRLLGLLRLGVPVGILLLDLLRVLDCLLRELVGMLDSLLTDLAVLHAMLCLELLAVQL